MERELRNFLKFVKTQREFNNWMRTCRKYMKFLRDTELVLRTGARQKYYAERARIQSMVLRAKKQRSTVKLGAGSCSKQLFWEDLDSAFSSRISSGMVVNINYIEPSEFLKNCEQLVKDRVDLVFRSANSVKINFIFNGEFITKDITEVKTINTKNRVLFKTDDFGDWFKSSAIEPILKKLDEFQERDSGWALHKILHLIVNINHYNPMRVGCHIKLSDSIINKRAVVNIHSKDNACFAWAVTAALNPVKENVNYLSSYPHFRDILKVEDITFPITLKQIRKFEVDNDISINIFTIEDNAEGDEKHLKVVPLQITHMKRKKHVNILLTNDEQGTAHFTWIKNLSRLVSSQLNKKKVAVHICER